MKAAAWFLLVGMALSVAGCGAFLEGLARGDDPVAVYRRQQEAAREGPKDPKAEAELKEARRLLVENTLKRVQAALDETSPRTVAAYDLALRILDDALAVVPDDRELLHARKTLEEKRKALRERIAGLIQDIQAALDQNQLARAKRYLRVLQRLDPEAADRFGIDVTEDELSPEVQKERIRRAIAAGALAHARNLAAVMTDLPADAPILLQIQQAEQAKVEQRVRAEALFLINHKHYRAAWESIQAMGRPQALPDVVQQIKREGPRFYHGQAKKQLENNRTGPAYLAIVMARELSKTDASVNALHGMLNEDMAQRVARSVAIVPLENIEALPEGGTKIAAAVRRHLLARNLYAVKILGEEESRRVVAAMKKGLATGQGGAADYLIDGLLSDSSPGMVAASGAPDGLSAGVGKSGAETVLVSIQMFDNRTGRMALSEDFDLPHPGSTPGKPSPKDYDELGAGIARAVVGVLNKRVTTLLSTTDLFLKQGKPDLAAGALADALFLCTKQAVGQKQADCEQVRTLSMQIGG